MEGVDGGGGVCHPLWGLHRPSFGWGSTGARAAAAAARGGWGTLTNHHHPCHPCIRSQWREGESSPLLRRCSLPTPTHLTPPCQHHPKSWGVPGVLFPGAYPLRAWGGGGCLWSSPTLHPLPSHPGTHSSGTPGRWLLLPHPSQCCHGAGIPAFPCLPAPFTGYTLGHGSTAGIGGRGDQCVPCLARVFLLRRGPGAWGVLKGGGGGHTRGAGREECVGPRTPQTPHAPTHTQCFHFSFTFPPWDFSYWGWGWRREDFFPPSQCQ